MKKNLIMILEDNPDRIRDFEAAIASMNSDYSLRLWHDAPTMLAECLTVFSNCCLVSLDHDLNPMPDAAQDPGTGLEVAEFLGKQRPICPVIIHSSNVEKRWSMHNEFRFGNWQVEIIPPIGDNWIFNSWLPRVKTLIASS